MTAVLQTPKESLAPKARVSPRLELVREGALRFDGWENFTADPYGTPVSFVSSDLPRGCALADSVTNLRTRFVEFQRWLTFKDGDYDHDRYDDIPETQVFAAGVGVSEYGVDGSSELAPETVDACMRLTRIDNAESSLSFSMWGSKVESDEFDLSFEPHRERLQASAEAGMLYDLTRLATDYESRDFSGDDVARSAALHAAVNNCFLMFGAGVAHTANPFEAVEGYSGPEAIWLFTINDSVRALLDASGIEYHTLMQDEISEGDGYSSSLCYLTVSGGVSQVRNVPGFVDARDLVEAGLGSHLLISRD